jgi:hypothetical protein
MYSQPQHTFIMLMAKMHLVPFLENHINETSLLIPQNYNPKNATFARV